MLVLEQPAGADLSQGLYPAVAAAAAVGDGALASVVVELVGGDDVGRRRIR